VFTAAALRKSGRRRWRTEARRMLHHPARACRKWSHRKKIIWSVPAPVRPVRLPERPARLASPQAPVRPGPGPGPGPGPARSSGRHRRRWPGPS